MTTYRTGFLVVAFGALTAFGTPNASGIYIINTPREVDLVQLVQTPDGKVTGRLEENTIGADGALGDKVIAVDGAVSQRDLMFKPANVWIGGLSGTGTFTDNNLTLVVGGTTLTFQRAALPVYQAALARLKTTAGTVRQQHASMQAAVSARAAQEKNAQDAINAAAKLEKMTAQVRDDTAKMNAGVANSPDFGQQAAANTARIERMMQAAPSMSDRDRSQLVVQANQIEVGTNQIEVARTQYAIQLNQFLIDARPIAERLEAFCGSANAANFARQCGPARAAIADLKTSIVAGQKSFSPYKEALQRELQRETAMIQRMGG